MSKLDEVMQKYTIETLPTLAGKSEAFITKRIEASGDVSDANLVEICVEYVLRESVEAGARALLEFAKENSSDVALIESIGEATLPEHIIVRGTPNFRGIIIAKLEEFFK